jgi:hypothetical protein
MDKKLKRKWVAALRGGSWKQCTYAFHGDGNERCVIGVLLGILEIEPGGLSLSDKLDPYLSIDSRSLLYTMNDRGLTFGEMADWIEVAL